MYEVEGVEPPEPTHPKSYTPFSVWKELSLINVLSTQIQSTLALRTPRYNGHHDNTDNS